MGFCTRTCQTRSQKLINHRRDKIKNFYYIATFNLTSPIVKKYLEDALLLVENGIIVDFKFRSKLFNTYDETVHASEYDFSNRITILYTDEDSKLEIDELIIVNPAYSIENIESNLKREWDETCCGALYYIDKSSPTDWIMKYEIYFAEDGIEVVRNGEFERLTQIVEDGDKFPSRLH